jgi:hypothetical protein
MAEAKGSPACGELVARMSQCQAQVPSAIRAVVERRAVAAGPGLLAGAPRAGFATSASGNTPAWPQHYSKPTP